MLRPRTITIQVDEKLGDLLDAAMQRFGGMTTPTQLARHAMEMGLIRLAVVASHSDSAAKVSKAALKACSASDIESACAKLAP